MTEKVCPACEGTGIGGGHYEPTDPTCTRCGGSGVIDRQAKRGRPPRREGDLTRSRSYSLTEAAHHAIADYALAHGHPSASAGLEEMVEKFCARIVDGAD